jgi:hypothetical protein
LARGNFSEGGKDLAFARTPLNFIHAIQREVASRYAPKGTRLGALHEIGLVTVAFLLQKKFEKNLKKSLPPS